MKILVAEDNPINQEVILAQFQKMGLEPELAQNGEDAVQKIQKDRFDLIFMDCQMPIKDGYQAVQEIRQYEGSARHTPIIAMTAHALAGDREKCLSSGMDDYLSKPIRFLELQNILQKWTKKNAPPEEKSSPAEHDRPQVNLPQLIESACGSEEAFKRMIHLYVRQTADLLNLIQQSLEKNQWKEIQEAAHKSAGSQALCGMKAMLQWLKEIETLSGNQEADKIRMSLQQVHLEFQRIQNFLSKYSYIQLKNMI